MNILTIDIGTSSCKAAVFTSDGIMLALTQEPYPLYFPKNDWVEQDPEEMMIGISRAVSRLWEQGVEPASVNAISFSAQIASQMLVDAQGRPLTNLISWMDMRAAEECDEFCSLYAQDEIRDMTGIDMVITPSYSISRLKWMRRHIPQTLDDAEKFVQIKDYLIFHLTGRWVSDVTSMKGLVHADTCRLVPEVLVFTETTESLFPEVKTPASIAGYLDTKLAGFDALPAGIPVITGWNDMNAGFLGMGAATNGCIGLDMTGTSEHLGCVRACEVVPTASYKGINRVPYLDGRECFYGVTSSGGQAVEWFVRDFLEQQDVKAFYDAVFAKPGISITPQPDSPLFLPYLEGERNPWNNPQAAGVFFGLKRHHRKEDLALSVLEGVCFALKAIFDRLPQQPEYVVVSGGASFNDEWNQMKADVMNTRFVRLTNAHSGCAGAAILALKALEPDRAFQDLSAIFCRPQKEYIPDSSRQQVYQKRYSRFLELYEASNVLFQGGS